MNLSHYSLHKNDALHLKINLFYNFNLNVHPSLSMENNSLHFYAVPVYKRLDLGNKI